MKILVTDSSFKHSLAIVRSLGKMGYSPYILSFKQFSLCSFSRYIAKELIIKREFDLKEFITICHINEISLVILVGTNSFRKIVPWKKDLQKENIDIISVDKESLDIAFSKQETYSLAQKIGVPIPLTFYPKSFDEISSLKKNISYPCVIKGLYEVGGNIVEYAYDKEELEKKYINLCKKYNIDKENGLPMLQEYITGDGCAFFAVYDNGNCGLTFQHKRVREYPISGGASVCAESYDNHLVEEYGRKILDNLNWHGVAMVEFKLNGRGIPILMEINPKFWGSTDLALEAGVNFPKALIDIYLGERITYSKNYELPLKYHWPLNGDILHGLENPKNLIKIVRDCIDPNVKSNIWISDFKPTFRLIFDFIRELAVQLIKRYI